ALRLRVERLQGGSQRLHLAVQPAVGPSALGRVQRDAVAETGGGPVEKINGIHERLLEFCYCTLSPAWVTTLPHLSISLSIRRCKVAGVFGVAGMTKPAAL